MILIDPQYQHMATAIHVMPRQILCERQMAPESQQEQTIMAVMFSPWYEVKIQDGMQLFGLDSFWEHYMGGWCHAFRQQFGQLSPRQGRLALDDGGWFAQMRKQPLPSFPSQEAALKVLARNHSEADAKRRLERNRQHFLNVLNGS